MAHCNVTFQSFEKARKEPEFLADVVNRLSWWEEQADTITVSCNDRVADDAPDYQFPGSIEWGINVRWISGGGLFVMAMQRSKGAKTEFHS